MMGWCVEGSFLIGGRVGVACPRLNGGGVGYGGWQCVGAFHAFIPLLSRQYGSEGWFLQGPPRIPIDLAGVLKRSLRSLTVHVRVHEPTCHAFWYMHHVKNKTAMRAPCLQGGPSHGAPRGDHLPPGAPGQAGAARVKCHFARACWNARQAAPAWNLPCSCGTEEQQRSCSARL